MRMMRRVSWLSRRALPIIANPRWPVGNFGTTPSFSNRTQPPEATRGRTWNSGDGAGTHQFLNFEPQAMYALYSAHRSSGNQPPMQPAGRLEAQLYLGRFGEQSMGAFVNHCLATARLVVIPLWLIPDLASGEIATFYRSLGDDFWNQQVSLAAIEHLADNETPWFQQQPGLAGVIGGTVSANLRKQALCWKAQQLGWI